MPSLTYSIRPFLSILSFFFFFHSSFYLVNLSTILPLFLPLFWLFHLTFHSIHPRNLTSLPSLPFPCLLSPIQSDFLPSHRSTFSMPSFAASSLRSLPSIRSTLLPFHSNPFHSSFDLFNFANIICTPAFSMLSSACSSSLSFPGNLTSLPCYLFNFAHFICTHTFSIPSFAYSSSPSSPSIRGALSAFIHPQDFRLNTIRGLFLFTTESTPVTNVSPTC